MGSGTWKYLAAANCRERTSTAEDGALQALARSQLQPLATGREGRARRHPLGPPARLCLPIAKRCRRRRGAYICSECREIRQIISGGQLNLADTIDEPAPTDVSPIVIMGEIVGS